MVVRSAPCALSTRTLQLVDFTNRIPTHNNTWDAVSQLSISDYQFLIPQSKEALLVPIFCKMVSLLVIILDTHAHPSSLNFVTCKILKARDVLYVEKMRMNVGLTWIH